tara:strand:+ start:9763 stop:10599 length:837 start_codon:yes stop_codon:yes gene_type:complete
VARRFVFTITTGRSGTAYLAELFKQNLTDAAVWHERTGFTTFGVDAPDLSHFTLFNSRGNVSRVNEFWRGKFDRDLQTPTTIHAETSHLLAKAGLLENIEMLLAKGGQIEVVVLKRDVFDTLWSFYNRFDFVKNGLAWAFYLDAAYPNVIFDSEPFLEHGAAGKALWYIFEMRARGTDDRRLLDDQHGVRFHEANLEDIADVDAGQTLLTDMYMLPARGVTCPAARNTIPFQFFGEDERKKLRRFCDQFSFEEEAAASAAAFLERGRRLGEGPATARK